MSVPLNMVMNLIHHIDVSVMLHTHAICLLISLSPLFWHQVLHESCCESLRPIQIFGLDTLYYNSKVHNDSDLQNMLVNLSQNQEYKCSITDQILLKGSTHSPLLGYCNRNNSIRYRHNPIDNYEEKGCHTVD